MSRAIGEAVQGSEVIGYFLYNGTVDTLWSTMLHATADEAWTKYNQDRDSSSKWPNCTCGKPPIEVQLYSSYGSGFHWPGSVCLDCRVIVDGYAPEGLTTPGRPNAT